MIKKTSSHIKCRATAFKVFMVVSRDSGVETTRMVAEKRLDLIPRPYKSRAASLEPITRAHSYRLPQPRMHWFDGFGREVRKSKANNVLSDSVEGIVDGGPRYASIRNVVEVVAGKCFLLLEESSRTKECRTINLKRNYAKAQTCLSSQVSKRQHNTLPHVWHVHPYEPVSWIGFALRRMGKLPHPGMLCDFISSNWCKGKGARKGFPAKTMCPYDERRN